MNSPPLARRRFLRSALGGAPVIACPGLIFAHSRTPALPNRDMVHEFVSVAHTDLPRTRKLLAQEPTLARAAWNWGSGDWETGLGGAAHTGSREIVRYLLANGARMDLFAAAVLGELEIVKATLTAFPEALHVPGPHGIPLFEHAKAGGEEAASVLEHLTSLGAAEREVEYVDLPLTAEEQEHYVGVYAADHRRGLELTITVKDGRLHGQPTGSPQLALYYQGGGIFWAPDAEAKLAFGLETTPARTVRITQFDLDVSATRKEE